MYMSDPTKLTPEVTANGDVDERRLCRPLDRPGWPVFAQTSLLNLCRNATAKVSCHDFSAP